MTSHFSPRVPPFSAVSRVSRLASLLPLLAVPGCAQSGSSLWYLRPTPVEALPDRIVPDTSRGATVEPAGTRCLNPLVDRASGTRFLMLRSVILADGPIGDYAVEPAGAFGIDQKSAVRVDCAIGRPLGSVPR